MRRLGHDNRKGYKAVSVAEGYGLWAKTYDKEHNPLISLEENFTLQMVDETGSIRGCRVLDFGCGTGRYCLHLAKRGARVVGLDTSPEMLAVAREKMAGYEFELRQGRLDEMNFPDGHFDLVVSALTLCHIEKLRPPFKELSRVLKKNGHIIVSDIHPVWPESGHDYTEFFQDGQEYRIPLYLHTLSEYQWLSKEFGLDVEQALEPRIDQKLVESFPSLKDYLETPLAMILKIRKL